MKKTLTKNMSKNYERNFRKKLINVIDTIN